MTPGTIVVLVFATAFNAALYGFKPWLTRAWDRPSEVSWFRWDATDGRRNWMVMAILAGLFEAALLIFAAVQLAS